ncbi:MAG: LysR family transcriptional regulator [Synergistaceae bacterium]|nr:LysR family transcriptional regulator [Synergistaceae bacterium]
MNLHQLRVFCTVVEEGAFRRAAEKLYLSQPSVSQHVASLEKAYSVQLFLRKGRTISLTSEGRALYVLASDLLQRADEIPERFRDMQTLSTGRLEMGVSSFAGAYILPGALATFRRDFPGISLSVKSRTAREILAEIKRGGLELAVLGQSFLSSRDSSLTYRSLGIDPLLSVESPEHLKKRKDPMITAQETLIRFGGDCPLAAHVDEYLLRKNVRFGHEVEVDDIETAKKLAEEGVGVAITSRLSVTRSLAESRLVPAPLKEMDPPPWEIQCVYSSSGGLSYPGWEMVKHFEAYGKGLLKEGGPRAAL